MSSNRTRVLLIRHGETLLSGEDTFAGSVDVLLSENGEKQAKLLADRLSSVSISAVYSSPMKRSVKTASFIAEPHNLEVQTYDGLKEINHGRWEEKTRGVVEMQFPVEYKSWEADPFTIAPEGGESGLNVLNRAIPVIHKIVEKHLNQTIVIVSHKATIRLLIASFMGFDLRRYRDNLDQQPCCLNILDFLAVPLQARLLLFNDISHYDSTEKLPSKPRLSKIWSTNTK